MNRISRKTAHVYNTQRDGAILPLMGFVMATLLVIIAFSINIGWIQLNGSRMQSAADLAAVSTLRHYANNANTTSRIFNARQFGREILRLNRPFFDRRGQLDRIRFGRLVDITEHEPQFVQDRSAITAVRIAPESQDDRVVNSFLPSLFSIDNVSLTTPAITAYQPTEVVLCIDASRSMNQPANGVGPRRNGSIPPTAGSRWFVLRDTIDRFLTTVSQRNPNVRISLVSFGGGVTHPIVSPLDREYTRIEIPLGPLDADEVTEVFDRYISYPCLGFGTNIFDSIEQSTDVLLDKGNTSANQFIILLTDGSQFFNNNPPRPAPVHATGKAVANSLQIHTINFRAQRNPELEAVANATGGSAFDASNQAQLDSAFTDLLREFDVELTD